MTSKRLYVIIALIATFSLSVQGFAESFSTPGVTSSVYDIPTGEFVAASLEELGMLVDNAENLDFAENSMLTVVVPSNLDFHLDPLEIHGKGQIYSDDFLIQNYSNMDVAVKLENIKYTFVNETDFLSLDSPPEIPFGLKNPSKLKEVYMLLHYENRDYEDFVITTKEMSETVDIILSAAEYDEEGNFAGLNEGSSLIFNFTGIVNHLPAIEWEDKDFLVSIEYTLTPCESGENDEVIEEVAEDEITVGTESQSMEPDTFAIEGEKIDKEQDMTDSEAGDISPPVSYPEDESDSADVTPSDEESSSPPDENEADPDLNSKNQEQNTTEP